MDLPANIIDLNTGTVGPQDYTVEFYWPKAWSAGQCERYETLVVLPTDNAYVTSGEYINTLYSAQAELLARKKAAQEALDQFTAFLQAQHVRLGPTQTVPPLEDFVEFCSYHVDYLYTPPIGILNFLFQNERFRNLLRRVRARITLIRNAIVRAMPRFCAVSWTKRLWFLMHGIRPPRTEQRLTCCPSSSVA